MNTDQLNKNNMFVAVNGVLDANTTKIALYQPIVNTVTKFTGLLDSIQGYATEQARDYSGITDEKGQTKERMAEKATEIASAGVGYARENNNPSLIALLDISKSSIIKARDTMAIDTTLLIIEEIEKILPELADHLITQEDLGELKQLHQKFIGLSETRWEKHNSGVSNTRKLATLFKEVNDLLENRLDVQMLKFKKSDPEFYVAYTNARKIHDLGGSKSDPETESQDTAA